VKEQRRKVLLPVFQLSEVTTAEDPRALTRAIKQGKGRPALTYHYRFVWDDHAGRGFNYNLFPVVLDRNAVPWPLGSLFILAQLEAETTPAMTTYQSRADDLAAYKEWLDTQNNPDDLLFQFPKIKLRRPTYRYRGYLQQQIQARVLAPSTAKRRIGTVVSFYRWLIANNYFQPEYPPWEETQYQLAFKTTEGVAVSKRVVSTDVGIRAPKSEDPFAGTIQDGGKLRPLTGKEQVWILEATEAKGNTECYLIQLFMLATGARIQTASTLRLRHFTSQNPRFSKLLTGDGELYKLKAGPGTGIDTKNDKTGVLQVPRPLYELLHTYALSRRAEVRRNRFMAKHGEHPDPYLFLTQQGSPYYTAKAETLRFNPDLDRRHRANRPACSPVPQGARDSLRACAPRQALPLPDPRPAGQLRHEHHRTADGTGAIGIDHPEPGAHDREGSPVARELCHHGPLPQLPQPDGCHLRGGEWVRRAVAALDRPGDERHGDR